MYTFKERVQAQKKLDEYLKPYKLESGYMDSILDISLPEHVNQIVLNRDGLTLFMRGELSPIIEEYVTRGRSERLESHARQVETQEAFFLLRDCRDVVASYIQSLMFKSFFYNRPLVARFF